MATLSTCSSGPAGAILLSNVAIFRGFFILATDAGEKLVAIFTFRFLMATIGFKKGLHNTFSSIKQLPIFRKHPKWQQTSTIGCQNRAGKSFGNTRTRSRRHPVERKELSGKPPSNRKKSLPTRGRKASLIL
jgi:hypothetical protein